MPPTVFLPKANNQSWFFSTSLEQEMLLKVVSGNIFKKYQFKNKSPHHRRHLVCSLMTILSWTHEITWQPFCTSDYSLIQKFKHAPKTQWVWKLKHILFCPQRCNVLFSPVTKCQGSDLVQSSFQLFSCLIFINRRGQKHISPVMWQSWHMIIVGADSFGGTACSLQMIASVVCKASERRPFFATVDLASWSQTVLCCLHHIKYVLAKKMHCGFYSCFLFWHMSLETSDPKNFFVCVLMKFDPEELIFRALFRNRRSLSITLSKNWISSGSKCTAEDRIQYFCANSQGSIYLC